MRMLTLVRGASLTAALLLLQAANGRAQICALPLNCPSLANSTHPSFIALMGHDGSGNTDPRGEFLVVFRDIANNPIPNAVIRVELTVSDVVLCADQQAGLTGHGASYVEGLTDQAGMFTVSLRGAGAGAAQQILSGPRGGQIFGNGQLLANIEVVAYDLDGTGGVGANDLSLWLQDFGLGQDFLRGDYDGDGSMGANDLSFWLTLFGGGASAASCSP